MSSAPKVDVLDLDGPGAPPRRNGELVFHAPWESRVFGLTLSLHRAGLFEWEEFRRLLIAEIERWEKHHGQEEWSYYERWQAAFEQLVAAKGLCRPNELSQRIEQFEARPPGHDHRESD
jgi:nitrile hydratase accessory protein